MPLFLCPSLAYRTHRPRAAAVLKKGKKKIVADIITHSESTRQDTPRVS